MAAVSLKMTESRIEMTKLQKSFVDLNSALNQIKCYIREKKEGRKRVEGERKRGEKEGGKGGRKKEKGEKGKREGGRQGMEERERT